MKVVITGGAGLVGSHAVDHWASEGHDVVAIDNFGRGEIFGKLGSTEGNAAELTQRWPKLRFLKSDIRNAEVMTEAFRGADVIIHAAAQPSHPRSIEIPMEDFQINAFGTLQLLEIARKAADNAVFVFCSTNKVYGENPNTIPKLVEKETRYDYADRDGIDEAMPVDTTMHTPFGVSKLAADVYAQEYARLYGLKTGIFRMCCITGPMAKAVELHNWEPYFLMQNMLGREIKIFGYKGKQVRDVIDARDLVQAFARFAEKPRPGEVYNMGGGRGNSISLLESFELIRSITGKQTRWSLHEKREGDHQVYITDLGKFKSHYPGWDIRIGLRSIFLDIYNWLAAHQEVLKSA